LIPDASDGMKEDPLEKISYEFYDLGQKSVYDAVMAYFAKTYHGGVWGELVNWLHDKLGIN